MNNCALASGHISNILWCFLLSSWCCWLRYVQVVYSRCMWSWQADRSVIRCLKLSHSWRPPFRRLVHIPLQKTYGRWLLILVAAVRLFPLIHVLATHQVHVFYRGLSGSIAWARISYWCAALASWDGWWSFIRDVIQFFLCKHWGILVVVDGGFPCGIRHIVTLW